MGNVFIVITIVVAVTLVIIGLVKLLFKAVEFVIDDRPCVCRQWRDMGLKVLQVGNPYIEF